MKIKINVGTIANNMIIFEQNDIVIKTLCVMKNVISLDNNTLDFFMMFPDKFKLRKYYKEFNYMIKEFEL
jgi:hypothetical protein